MTSNKTADDCFYLVNISEFDGQAPQTSTPPTHTIYYNKVGGRIKF